MVGEGELLSKAKGVRISCTCDHGVGMGLESQPPHAVLRPALCRFGRGGISFRVDQEREREGDRCKDGEGERERERERERGRGRGGGREIYIRIERER